ncbi:gamma-glutamylcyclotransferase family protein [Pseudomarimonas arenosa]|uniref:Gamma-glutamylcyclotransferase n=1 Tax=Pseudomarimonas arenosa TaxID=2774145 RepID=A0AAW3ZHV3_9GAMM|nr:gamma-glutamylcyclotransferase family protein [Pseudomarimonas arenosa]MBD8524829.1 gamma-glutamylcyclotransferase [Pseudomarimonas arenosa]
MSDALQLYFAYGSNMLSRRLQAPDRAPSALALAVASLPGHRLRFDKRGQDGSGKCDAEFSAVEQDCVHGVVYQIDPAHWPALDRAEGLGRGYRRAMVEVRSATQSLQCLTYLATDKHPDLLPFDWYKALVLAGAEQHDLPLDYRRWLHEVPCLADPDRARHALNMTLLE